MAGSSEGKVKRKTFVAREDLLDRLSDVAKARGYSLYALVNEIFELVLEADEMGLDLRRVVEERGILEKAKKAGLVLGLENLHYGMADLAYSRAKNKAVESWFEAGVWFGKRYVIGGVSEPFEAFKRDLETFIWNANLALERAGDRLSLRVISPRFNEAYTHLLAAFFEGAISAFNYEVVERDVFKGNIRLDAVRKEENVQR
ncbi:hypothetical protein H5T51_02535 [Candidatus Bathyarchaeota archaeon]|nr:hypothetical protein [Candidatus Bathyarchaeota archaeon]